MTSIWGLIAFEGSLSRRPTHLLKWASRRKYTIHILVKPYCTCKQTNMLKFRQFQNEFMKSSFLTKYKRKIVRISALCSEGRNLDNFLFVFWEKRWLHKFILKMSDLSSGLKKVSKYYKLIIFIKFNLYMYCHV